PTGENPGTRARQILEEEDTIRTAIETAGARAGGPRVYIPRGVLDEQAGQIVRDDSSIGGGWMPIDALSSARSLSSLGRPNELEVQIDRIVTSAERRLGMMVSGHHLARDNFYVRPTLNGRYELLWLYPTTRAPK